MACLAWKATCWPDWPRGRRGGRRGGGGKGDLCPTVLVVLERENLTDSPKGVKLGRRVSVSRQHFSLCQRPRVSDVAFRRVFR